MQSFQALNQFNPSTETTVVCNAQEFESRIDGYVNFAIGFDVPHNSRPVPTREPSSIKFIVLHETSSDSGGGFQPPFTAHFVVKKTGAINQFNDLCEAQQHAGIFNTAAVGIEFVNRDWEDGRGVRRDRVPDRLAEEHGYVWTFWGDGYNIYKLPESTQLEKLVDLLRRLLNQGDGGLPFIEPIWLQHVSYNDCSTLWDLPEDAVPSTDEEKASPRFFVFSNAYSFMLPNAFDHLGSGILSHNSISNIQSNGLTDENAHTDGSFEALYSMLRINFDYEPDAALEKAASLMRSRLVRATTKQPLRWLEKNEAGEMVERSGKRTVYLLDVSDI
jgi:hypothetical protein